MKHALSGAWLTPLRIFVVAVLAQPAVATLIHDTAVRYGISGAVVAAVEAAVIASSSSKGALTKGSP